MKKFNMISLPGIMMVVSLAFVSAPVRSCAQETIFTMMKSDERKASMFFQRGAYAQALQLYKTLRQRASNTVFDLQIARSYYHLHETADAARTYGNVIAQGQTLPDKDLYLYAECLTSIGSYDEALQYYKAYQDADDTNEVAMRKIWQIKNREFLFEDSANFSVRALPFSTMASDIGAVPVDSGVLFLSNKKKQSFVSKVDSRHEPFYRVYESRRLTDSLGNDLGFQSVRNALDWMDSRYQLGPFSVYNGGKSIAYVASSHALVGSKRTLQIFFAARVAGAWKTTGAFAHNPSSASVTSVAVSEDGLSLYFAAELPGGLGGLDLYVSKLVERQWTKPVNLGSRINTSGNENFPSIWGNKLYFATDGHPGLGGLDIFSVRIDVSDDTEPENLGYPANTRFDDFGLTLNRDGSKGYFTSNRLNGNDDIYELILHLQSYPYTITGVLKYRDNAWTNGGEPKVYPNAHLALIDNQTNAVVFTSQADGEGLFTLTIPYFSQYRIRIDGPDNAEDAMVSLDLAKTRNNENRYEVVVVRNSFRKGFK